MTETAARTITVRVFGPRGRGRAAVSLIEVTVPTLADVRAWVGVSLTSITDAQLQGVIDAEVALQASTCDLTPTDETSTAYPPEMVQALYRRVARECAARGLPLGLTDVVGEYGPARIPTFDAEISRLEAPRRNVVVA
jgi:hypothetical protein